MPTPLEILEQYWGFSSFRPLQEEIINSVLEGRDSLALLPTGGGKSLCFQLPVLCGDGMGLVVSPLIALMKDQVERLNSLGIPATYINSSLKPRQIDRRLQGAMDGKYRFLYLAPERIRTEIFLARLPKMPVKLLVVDEAHCISQWGYDFRPAYLEIHKVRELLPDLPVIALTATATPAVKKDIQEKLQMKKPQVFFGSFLRKNLRYGVLKDENRVERMLRVIRKVPGCGIVYVRTRKRAEFLANYLREQEVMALAYHGGMLTSERDEAQRKWLDDEVRIMVATNAFGMGIDKAAVRLVLHFNLPFDLESYYQEAGRAGRDGETAYAIAFDSKPDMEEMHRWNRQKYPSWEDLETHYQLLCQHLRITSNAAPDEVFPLNLSAIAGEGATSVLKLYQSLKLLDREEVIEFSEDKDDYGYVQVVSSPADILQFKEDRPMLAPLLDHLLRTLGGEVYTRELRFLPYTWARQLDLPPLEIHHQFDQLQKHDLLVFRPPVSVPTVRLLVPRGKLNKKALNWDTYKFLEAQSDRRLRSMSDYVANVDSCRSRMIQEYFGEKTQDNCGECDVCLGRTRRSLSEDEFTLISEAIQTYLKKSPANFRDTLLGIRRGSSEQRKAVLREMLDKGAILADARGILRSK